MFYFSVKMALVDYLISVKCNYKDYNDSAIVANTTLFM